MGPFDKKDIERSFSSTILDRGRQYLRAGKVIDAWYDNCGVLYGKVRGTGSRPYEVEIGFIPRARFTKLDSECTCPYGEQCKHAAALALYALTHELRTEESEERFDDYAGEQESVQETATHKSLSIPKAPEVSLDLPVPRDVKEWLHHVRGSLVDPHDSDPSSKYRIFYRLQTHITSSGNEIPTVVPISRSLLKSGALGVATEMKSSAILSPQTPKYWTRFDVNLLQDLNTNATKLDWNRAEYRLDGPNGVRLLGQLLTSGRCVWDESPPLSQGEIRTGSFTWQKVGNTGSCLPAINVDQPCVILATTAPWYIDLDSYECGPLECGLPSNLAAALIRTGLIEPEHISAVREEFDRLGLPQALFPEPTIEVIVRAPMPTPCLSVDFETCQSKSYLWSSPSITAPIAFALLAFEYENFKAPEDSRDLRIVQDDKLLILKRNHVAEKYAKDFLVRCGWQDSAYCGYTIPNVRSRSLSIVPKNDKTPLDPIHKVAAFAKTVVPDLVAAGWKISIDENFRFVPDSKVEWDIAIESGSGIDWFEFKLGIRVEGEPFDLKSILGNLVSELGEGRTFGAQAQKGKTDDIFVFGLNGRAIKLSRARLSAILQPLVEIFGGVTEWPDDLRLPRSMAPEIDRFEKSVGAASVPWKSNDELQRLRRQFADFDRLEPLAEPIGFTGQLRPYQREGLAWLQFLREYGFGGILADDMGLGKTVQLLAHIQTEKAAGRMDRPCLIVAPTSTMPNWRRECERFAPHLKVLTLQGTGRSGKFAELKDVDIALTTYPLLARDKAHLLKSNYHILVLDEAQNVKNPVTAAAKAVRELDARHRICLSGTPVENHLGELWALFHFLMPGFLGSDSDFRKKFRVPIEKSADAAARERLAHRIRPFMLRRTKGQVVHELPPKTEVVETVEFGDQQRDLYESIRIAMDEQVRKLIASQGFDRSRIQILDALLKLRQVCCDPRLVKLPSAKSVTDSAKLDRLMEMLGVLVEDGRKVLLFSQFTSMLDLIEGRLRAAEIQWVRISGDTVDRETPVKRFQAGEVPLFLISLKAGGTGLNLTAADTVILYDPWWNPAVENQAIDRAHRIGQEKAVIVYKMVAAGTIEEKMLEMQAKKGDIAKSILTDDADGIRTLTADDLRWVLSSE